jgi:cysteine-rich repeat protein
MALMQRRHARYAAELGDRAAIDRRCRALSRLGWGVVATILVSLASCATSDPLLEPTGDGGLDAAAGPSAGNGTPSSGTSVPAGGGSSEASGGTGGASSGAGGASGASTGPGTGATSTSSGSASCGNGVVDPSEECDDANVTPGDGCDPACVIECGSDAIKSSVDGHCYRIFLQALHAPDAQQECEDWGGAPGLGHLVSIQNSTEQGFVGQLATTKAWIGGGDAAVEGTYEWYDGTPWIYENWAPDEPNDITVEDCMFFQVGGKWDDHDCNDPRPAYICERRGAGTF